MSVRINTNTRTQIVPPVDTAGLSQASFAPQNTLTVFAISGASVGYWSCRG